LPTSVRWSPGSGAVERHTHPEARVRRRNLSIPAGVMIEAPSKNRVRRAGERIIAAHQNGDEWPADDVDVVVAWRGMHAEPVEWLAESARRRTDRPVSYLLKRLPQVVAKLVRQRNMGLERMQDLAGYRIVVDTNKEVDQVVAEVTGRAKPHYEVRDTDDYRAALGTGQVSVTEVETAAAASAPTSPADVPTGEHAHVGKYRPLWEWLLRQERREIRISFFDLEHQTGISLPDSCRNHPAHWHSYQGSAVVRAIVDAGWHAERVDLNARMVSLVPGPAPRSR
jgi:hypothetical protein